MEYTEYYCNYCGALEQITTDEMSKLIECYLCGNEDINEA